MKIVVAGGGTAGWITAYIIDEAQPGKHDITVIESSSIGIIGAGEGSTGLLYDLVSGHFFGRNDLGNIIDFLEETDSTPKFGIYHQNWSKSSGEGYFAPLDYSPTGEYAPDPMFNYVLSKFGPKKAHLASYMGQSYESNKFPNTGFGFHFNAYKVGQFFKKRLESRKNVTVVDAVINEVNLDEKRDISSVSLDSSQEIHGDLFFDCTGFARVLMSKLDNPWVSYKENLIADRAMPFILDYTESSRKETKPYTTAHAQSAGWMWDIPLQNRRGCGYVYSSDFLTEDEAQQEIENYVGQPIEPIKHLKFDAGRSDRLWVNNCVASGLSAVFMEPLEATSIHTTIYQMLNFVMDYLTPEKKTTMTRANAQSFNEKFMIFNDSVRDFLNLHYQGGRNDSEFWKYLSTGATMTPFVEEVIDRAKNKLPSHTQYEHRWGTNTSLWNWIICGLEFVNPDAAARELSTFSKEEEASSMYFNFVEQSQQRNQNQDNFSLERFILQ